MQPDAIGPVLRRMRLDNDLTLERLSELSGISDRALSDIERGVARGPQQRTILAIARALRLSDADRAVLVEAARAGRRCRTGSSLPPLPGEVPDFTGRDRQLAEITTTLAARPSCQVVVTGPPGSGKTSLVVHAAGRLRESFPDQLFVSLGGSIPGPPSADEVTARLVHALAGRPRRRPLLLVLDDAAAELQVRAARSLAVQAAVLVTSRRSLAGLDASGRIPLDRLSWAEALHLLAAIIPADQRTDPALLRVAELCDRVPLALRIAGNRVASRPGWTASDLVQRLRPRSSRLDALTAGDLRMGAAIRSSVERLDPGTRQLFRRLATIEAATFTLEAAAALVGPERSRTETMLDELVELNLIEPAAGDRYALCGLIRLYAEKELSAAEATAPREAVRTADGRSPARSEGGNRPAARRLAERHLARPRSTAGRRITAAAGD